MHGTEHRVRSAGRLVCELPGNRFMPAAASSLPGAPRLFSKTGPFARNGLSLVRNGVRLRGFHSGVNGPGLLLRSLACRIAARSAFRLRRRLLVCPSFRLHPSPQARCSLYRPALPAVSPASAPLREFWLPPDQSVPLASQPFGPPSENARSSFAPRSLLFRKDWPRIIVPDSLRFQRLCCSSNLLEPSSL